MRRVGVGADATVDAIAVAGAAVGGDASGIATATGARTPSTAVPTVASASDTPAARGDVDDAPALLPDHRRQRGAGADERRLHVHREELVELAVVGLDDRTGREAAGEVQQYVDAAVRRDDARDERLDVGAAGEL